MDLKNHQTGGAAIGKGNGEITEVWETLMGIRQVVKLKHKAEWLINVYCVPSTLLNHERLRGMNHALRILPVVQL